MLMLGTWLVTLMGTLFVLVCLFMMLIILIQKPRGGGLSGAFGGAGNAQAAFGAKTGDVLTWFTVVCFTAFLLLAVGLTWMIRPSDPTQAIADSLVENETETTTSDVSSEATEQPPAPPPMDDPVSPPPPLEMEP